MHAALERPVAACLVVRTMGIGTDGDTGLVARWTAVLSGDELDRAGRFRFAADRRRFVAARWLLRTELAARTGIPPEDWEFVTGPRGKPAAHPRFGAAPAFSLSHSGGLCMVALTEGRAVGVDVQESTGGYARLLGQCTSARERDELAGLPEVDRADRFFDLWTLKEAYLKARGLGIADHAMSTVEFDFAEGRPRLVPGHRGDWSTWDCQLVAVPAGYRAALCVAAG